MANEIIAVFGATGTQGSGVVKELLGRGQVGVRVLTRNPKSEKATVSFCVNFMHKKIHP